MFEASQRACNLYLNYVQCSKFYCYVRGSQLINISLLLLLAVGSATAPSEVAPVIALPAALMPGAVTINQA